MDQGKFLKTLFDSDQQTCFSKDPYGTEIASTPGPNDVFFSINAMHTSRRDDHVVCYRNFLIELDNMPLSQQIEYVTTKVPVSSIVFSGNKSYHFIISLKDAVTQAQYASIASGLSRLLPAADKSTKNPSRFSRLPCVVRPDTKLMQELVYLGPRIDEKLLPEFPKPDLYYERQPAKNVLFVTQQMREAQSNVDAFIIQHFSGRNQFFYWLGKRCAELGHTRQEKKLTVERFYDRLQNKRGFSIREAYQAARVKF